MLNYNIQQINIVESFVLCFLSLFWGLSYHTWNGLRKTFKLNEMARSTLNCIFSKTKSNYKTPEDV